MVAALVGAPEDGDLARLGVVAAVVLAVLLHEAQERGRVCVRRERHLALHRRHQLRSSERAPGGEQAQRQERSGRHFHRFCCVCSDDDDCESPS